MEPENTVHHGHAHAHTDEQHAQHEHGHEHHSNELPSSEQVVHAEPSSPSLLLQNANVKSPQFRDEKIEFFFKGKKDPITKQIIPGSKRPNVELVVPVLTFEGFIHTLENGGEKVQNYILDLINQAIKEGARTQVVDEDKPVNRQSELDIQKLTVEYLASIPPSERGGPQISDELWADFEKDYISVMVEVTKKPLEKVQKAAKLFLSKLNPVKAEKNVLAFLQEQLSIWGANSTQLEDLAEVYKYLDGRITTLLNKDEKNILESL